MLNTLARYEQAQYKFPKKEEAGKYPMGGVLSTVLLVFLWCYSFWC